MVHEDPSEFGRLDRPLYLTSRVEQLLRQAIVEERFADGRLPTEMELAKQLGVSRETVRLAAENLQKEGLLVKIRGKGTFLRAPEFPEYIETSTALGYLQAAYPSGQRQEDMVSRLVGALMLQGATEEASQAGMRLLVQRAAYTQIGTAFRKLQQEQRLRGIIFAHYGEEKLLRRTEGLHLPVVLLDHDLQLARISSVRDDSFAAAREVVRYLADLGHRRIAFINWRRDDLNPWRLQGYRQGLRDLSLPRRRAWEFAAELTPAGVAAVMDELLALTPRPSAVYCFNNTLAALVMAELHKRAVLVPGEMSVLGGGGEEVAGLTCHQADWLQMGRLAVQLLLRNLAEPETRAPEHLLCPHAIRNGQTTASLG